MSPSDRDPLFFPPHKQPPEGEEPEERVAEVDPAAQQKPLAFIVVGGVALLVVVLLSLNRETIRGWWAGRSPAPRAAAPAAAQPSPQSEAEQLLERALDGAPDLARIEQRAEAWRGRLRRDGRLWELVQRALAARDLRVRAAAMEVDLAASGTPKTPVSVDRLIEEAEPGKSVRPAALWSLGLLAGRGVEPDRARQAIVSYLHDPQEEVRYWAVEALPHTGQEEAVAPLLDALRNDPAPRVRERAARALGGGGLLTPEQRRTALPRLIQYAGDPALPPATRKLVFQALRDITGERLGDDAGAWSRWYTAQSHPAPPG